MRWAVSPKILADSATEGLGLATARQCANLFAATVSLGLFAWWLGLDRVGALLAAAAGFVLVVAATLRLAPSIEPVRWTGAFGLLAFPVVVAWSDADVAPAALPWLIVLPLFGTIIDGRRVGLLFAGLATLCIAVTVGGLLGGGVHSSGIARPVILALSAGSLVALVGVVVAVTSRYAAARTATLEQLASAERGLARAREQALLAERLASLGTLAAGVAHEINNPMVFVAGNVESVLRQMKAARRDGATAIDLAECEAALADAMNGATRVRDIVADLRTFAHAPDESLRAVDVGKVLGAVGRIVHNQLRHHAVLEISTEPGLAVLASESRLSQVLVNLLTNAMQAMPSRPPKDNRIALRGRALDGDRAVIEVEDNGSGVSAEAMDRVFEPFFTTKPIGVGTGLGLYVCRNLVTAMNGALALTSEVGRRTLATVELARASRPAASVAPPPTLPPPPERRRVLIVDDEPLVSRALARMLRSRSDVTTVASVDEALSVLDQARFDAILCDVMMPGRGGAELLKELTARDATLAARVGFITGGAFDSVSQALLDAMGDRWISKPFDAGAVEVLLERLSR
jgi:signal transduction histidine kinase/CheY-like chemotaxis protein